MRFPLSEPPKKPTNWWKTIPGQLSLIVMLIGAIVIVLGLSGVISMY